MEHHLSSLLVFVADGWPGALMGQRRFRHKTQKLSFRIVFWLTMLLHMGIMATVAYAFSLPSSPAM